MVKGQSAIIIGGYWNPIGRWKIGDKVTIKEVFEESVTVEEFFGRLPKSEIKIVNSYTQFDYYVQQRG